jgi:hypothetical protein
MMMKYTEEDYMALLKLIRSQDMETAAKVFAQFITEKSVDPEVKQYVPLLEDTFKIGAIWGLGVDVKPIPKKFPTLIEAYPYDNML